MADWSTDWGSPIGLIKNTLALGAIQLLPQRGIFRTELGILFGQVAEGGCDECRQMVEPPIDALSVRIQRLLGHLENLRT
jgi:hypothetical protein